MVAAADISSMKTTFSPIYLPYSIHIVAYSSGLQSVLSADWVELGICGLTLSLIPQDDIPPQDHMSDKMIKERKIKHWIYLAN